MCAAHRLKLAAAQTRKLASFVPNPEHPVAVLVQAGNPAVQQARGRSGIERTYAYAVETEQASVGPQPQIAIVRLHYRRDRVLFQALPHFPDVERALQAVRACGSPEVNAAERPTQP